MTIKDLINLLSTRTNRVIKLVAEIEVLEYSISETIHEIDETLKIMLASAEKAKKE